MNKITLLIVLCVIILSLTGCINESAIDSATDLGKTDDTVQDEDLKEVQDMKKVSDECAEEPSKCADDSGLLALTQQANPESACEGIPHWGWKQVCLALVKKDIKLCDKFVDADTEHYVPEHYRAWCRVHVIAVSGKSELCGTADIGVPGETKEQSVSNCYIVSALAQKKKELCSKTDSKEYCERLYAALNEKSLSVCENLGDTCYLDYAFRFKDKSACSKVSDAFKLACEVQLSGDSEKCRQINDLNQWYFCDMRSRYPSMMPQPGVYNPAPCKSINQCYRTVLEEMTYYLAGK